MKDLMKTLLEVLLILGLVYMLTGCRTMAATGRLIQAGGQDIELMAEGYRANLSK